MTSNQHIAFLGNFEVEDDAFEMTAERFILRGDGISFQLKFYETDYGKSTATGTAQRNSLGGFNCDDLRLRYATDKSDIPAVVRFSKIDASDDQSALSVEGTWEQAGDTFRFSGLLKRFKS
ncbi:hypothetical protein [Tahibacter soli]|uniref:Uncharacterized protein n=1 Tax=Tahibacter soli TaxID=2983605 RepID=A0A9X3YHB6_9GAMM|nr:hypothetical protein [Tahibacter soli]MDC8012277.1 hypothetical protein [Tahibacter soli]